MSIVTDGEQIHAVYAVVNPEKLAKVTKASDFTNEATNSTKQ
jgi:hypothetical protein